MHQECELFLPAPEPEGEEIIKAEIWHKNHGRFKLTEIQKAIARMLGLSVLKVWKCVSSDSFGIAFCLPIKVGEEMGSSEDSLGGQ